jgi:2-oxo-4-hydroxy-4-carboxy-5-ureidoimidazoline decarboxylase
MTTLLTMYDVNAMKREEFVRTFGGVFEQSPWIAEAASVKRPFATLTDLHAAMGAIVQNATEEKKLQLIRAHPDLVGRAALAGTLTRESTKEQASAGLNSLSSEEVALFQKNNAAYQSRFGFPFIICARLTKKEAILAGFQKRLQNSREQEIQTALEEIFKIADLRLRDLVGA